LGDRYPFASGLAEPGGQRRFSQQLDDRIAERCSLSSPPHLIVAQAFARVLAGGRGAHYSLAGEDPTIGPALDSKVMAKSKRRLVVPPPVKRCKICESAAGPWTKEDAIPRWLDGHMRDALRAMPSERVPAGWEQQRRVVLKPVCQTCQRRLNTEFENPAKQLLLDMVAGANRTLSSRDQLIAAAWFAKTAFVLGLASTAHRGDVERLRQLASSTLRTLAPPGDASVRLAYSSVLVGPTSSPLLPRGWRESHQGLFSSVFWVGSLVVELMVGSPPTMRSFLAATQGDPRFVQMWPLVGGPVQWPPAERVAINAGNALSDAWGHPANIRRGLGLFFRALGVGADDT
jgi:hypothetical protein